jgi:hypothetical protein
VAHRNVPGLSQCCRAMRTRAALAGEVPGNLDIASNSRPPACSRSQRADDGAESSRGPIVPTARYALVALRAELSLCTSDNEPTPPQRTLRTRRHRRWPPRASVANESQLQPFSRVYSLIRGRRRRCRRGVVAANDSRDGGVRPSRTKVTGGLGRRALPHGGRAGGRWLKIRRGRIDTYRS